MVRRFDEPSDDLIGQVRVPVVANAARMHDFYLGGTTNFVCDRTLAKRVLAAVPSFAAAAKANKVFMMRAVQYCAEAGGVRQFVHVGPGLSTSRSLRSIVRSTHSDATVVAVDDDPFVLSHLRAKDVPIVEGDIRRPGDVLADRRLKAVIDWSQPVGVLMGAVLHHVTDDHDPYGVVEAFRPRIAPGSLMVLSHLCSSGGDPAAIAKAEAAYTEASLPLKLRTHEQIQRFFGGFQLVDPGIVQVQHWQERAVPAMAVSMLGGIGRKPEPGTV